MATITIGLSGSAVANGSKNYALTDDAVSRLIAATRYRFKTESVGKTDGQVLAMWADSVIADTKHLVLELEKQAQNAGVTEIAIA
jgi:hypothetical protein